MLGGGVAGCELAQLYRRLGSEVTIFQRNERLVPRLDGEAGDLLRATFEEEGIELRFGADAKAAMELGAERLLVATGRAANAEGLGLEQLGVTITKHGIETDERLRAAENVWAIGDCTTHPQFTHLGKYQARIAAADIAGRKTRADYRAIPAVAFTDPADRRRRHDGGRGPGRGALERREDLGIQSSGEPSSTTIRCQSGHS